MKNDSSQNFFSSNRKMQQQQHEKKIESNFKPFKDAPIIKEEEITV